MLGKFGKKVVEKGIGFEKEDIRDPKMLRERKMFSCPEKVIGEREKETTNRMGEGKNHPPQAFGKACKSHTALRVPTHMHVHCLSAT